MRIGRPEARRAPGGALPRPRVDSGLVTNRVPRALPRGVPGLSLSARVTGGVAALALVAGLPPAVAAHGLAPTYQSPLPLAVYLAGAAITVGLSFAFVLARDLRTLPGPEVRRVRVPVPVRAALRAMGLLGWAWIMLQAIAGGSSDAAVAGLFLWVYGWVGIALISALAFPVWEWLDPFATLYDLLAWPLRRLGIRGWTPAVLPVSARHWPAVAGLAFFVWLELVVEPGTSGLAVVLAGYTLLTLALMAQFGRDRWRTEGETFTVWFRTLNRLAPLGIARRDDATAAWDAARGPVEVDPTTIVRRSFASGVVYAPWTTPVILLVAVGTASILFDGLSQTTAFASVFGAPAIGPKTLLLLAWLGLVAGAALAVARSVSPGAIGAGLLPISVGYLAAHYLTYLLIDGQRIVIAVSDPLQNGSDLFRTASFQPGGAWLPPGLVWTLQVAAVVGGHMLGAWSGHVTAQRDLAAPAGNGRNGDARDLRHRRIHDATPLPDHPPRNLRAREVPLAVVMVALTTITLWSLGQAIVVEPAESGSTGPEITVRG
jgi:hypothetical protein